MENIILGPSYALIIHCEGCIETPIERVWKKKKRGPLRGAPQRTGAQ